VRRMVSIDSIRASEALCQRLANTCIRHSCVGLQTASLCNRKMAKVHAAAIWRQASHAAHAATFLILLVTGVLLFSPAIRSQIVGGYSLHLRLIHCWTGVIFALATVPFLMHALRPGSIRQARGQGLPGNNLHLWRRAHLLFTVGATAAFTASGVLLWQQGRFGLALTDASATVHLWLTYAAAAVLAGHLCVAVFGLRRSRDPMGAGVSPLHGEEQMQSRGVRSC